MFYNYYEHNANICYILKQLTSKIRNDNAHI